MKKIKFGYGHMDMGNTIFKEYVKGDHKFAPFNPDRCRTGTHIAIVDALGGDRIPLSLTFDYRNLDTDIIYLWLQGGAHNGSLPVQILEKMRSEWDGVLLINFEEVYWFTDAYCQHAIRGFLESTKLVDAVVCGFHGYGERLKNLGFNDIPWRYLVTPYDTEWLRHRFSKMEKDSPKRVYGTVHGRATRCDKTLLVMNAIKDLDLDLTLNRYRFLSLVDLKRKAAQRVGIEHLDFINFIETIDPWQKYMEFLASTYVFIDEYPAYSQSHSTLDAASSGTPTVSHPFNSVSVRCFPESTVSNFNTNSDWIKITTDLLTDEDYYKRVREHGLKTVDHYGMESFKSQLEGLYKELKR